MPLFWLAPIAGAIVGAGVYAWVAHVLPTERVEPGLRPAPVGPAALR